MNQSDFNQLVHLTLRRMEDLLEAKGNEYTDDVDRLSNFKQAAQRMGITPLQVWNIYADKHWAAIASYTRDAAAGRSRIRSEPIDGRFHDMLNYCLLGLALIEESRHASEQAADA